MADILFKNMCTADVCIRSEQVRVTILIVQYLVMAQCHNKCEYQVSENTLPLENCTLLGYYAANSGNFLPTFQYNL